MAADFSSAEIQARGRSNNFFAVLRAKSCPSGRPTVHDKHQLTTALGINEQFLSLAPTKGKFEICSFFIF